MWAGSNRRLNDLDLPALHATPAHRSTPVGRLSLLIFPHPCFKSQVRRQEFARCPVGTPAVLSDVYRGFPRFLLAYSGKVQYLCYVTATRQLAVCRALHEEPWEVTVDDTRCGSSERDELWTGESALFVGVT
jgi:hypothetical protein